jgi:redox-sensitive bicupin YhaK (pirin superfamily)
VIEAGGVQWMTAGSGLEHSEVSSADFKRDGGPLEILQLWVNLPSRLKMVKPQYVGLQREDIPSFELDDGKGQLDLIAGDWAGHKGPITSLTGIHMATIALSAGASIRLEAPAARAVFLYVVRGEISVSGQVIQAQHLVEVAHDGDVLDIAANGDSFLVFGHGDPIGEPVVSHGPFVMNTREEILEAIRDYQAGKFGGGL